MTPAEPRGGGSSSPASGAAPVEPLLGRATLLALGLNGVVGVGIFFAPSGIASAVTGGAAAWVFPITALLLLPVAVAFGLLGGRYREDGGPVVWATRAFGQGVGFAVGWIGWVSAVFSTAAVIAGLARYALPTALAGSAHGTRLLAVALLLGLALVVAWGLAPSARLWTGLTVLKLLPLLALAALGLAAGAALGTPAAAAGGAAPASSAADGAPGRALLVALFALQGFEIVAVPAGRVRGGARTVLLCTLGALLLPALLYTALHRACLVAVPDLAGADAPLVAAAAALGGATLGGLVAVGTNVSALGIALGMVAMTPRYLAALAATSAGFGALRVERRAVPLRALALTVALVLPLVLAGEGAELFVLASLAVLAQYAAAVASLGVLAWRRSDGLRRIDLWPAPLALGALALIGSAATRREALVAGGALAVGALLRGLAAGRRVA